MLLKSFILTVVFVLGASCILFSQAAESDLRRDVDELKLEVQLLQNDISELKAILIQLATLLQPQPQQQQPQQVDIRGRVFDIGDNPVAGSESAKLIMVEFSDYQCPYCGRFTRETLPEIMKQYVDGGKIRYTVIDQPLPMHPEAPKAAEAAHCANDQGKFWEMHEALMANQDNLKNLSYYAKSLNLNIVEYENCLNTEKYKDAVNRNMSLAGDLGIDGVPGFILASVDAKDPRRVTGITTIVGAVPFVNFRQELDAALENQ